MKKIIVVVMLLFACLSSEAQKFLRYQMNNNTYNGFYTNGIGSILHDYKNGIATTFVHASGKVYEIPINDIDSISVEDVNVANGNLGQYRIYEFNYEEGDIKKIYVDNRASLFAAIMEISEQMTRYFFHRHIMILHGYFIQIIKEE